MATAKTILQNVGKNFLNSGNVDRAIRIASQGKFHDMNMMLQQMVNDLYPYFHGAGGNSIVTEERIRAALKDVCGIDLQNDDTGSVFGSDAGSGAQKKADAVIADAVPKQIWPNGKTTTIKGLTINAPAKNKLTAVQQKVVLAIYNRWSAGALDAMEQALGVSFAAKSANLGLRNITISFAAPTDDSGKAYWNHQMMYAVKTGSKLCLYVNLANREIKDWTNGTVYNKRTGKYEEYMDRMLAREYSRIFLDQVNSYDKVNETKLRSLYELVSGADDTLTASIRNVVADWGANGYKFRDNLASDGFYNHTQTFLNQPSDNQSALSYLGWRYFLKKSAEFINNKQADKSLVWGADGKSVTIGKNYQGKLNINNGPLVITGYDPKRVTLIASTYTLKKLRYGQDVTDLVLTWDGKESIRFKNVLGLGKKISVYSSENNNSYMDYSISVPSFNKKTGMVTLDKEYAGTMDLRNKAYASAANLNAAATTHKVMLYGNGKNNTITAGKAGSVLRGFGGTNTLIGGDGVDTFYAGNGEGNTVMKKFAFASTQNSSVGDVLQLTSGTKLVNTARSGRDLILKFSNGGTAKIVNGAGNWLKINGLNGIAAGGQKFYAVKGGGRLCSMNGNDKIYCSNSADRIYFGRNYGQDTVYNGRKNDIVYLFDVNNIGLVHGSKSANGVMKLSFTGRSDTLSLANWNANTGLNTIQLANNQKYRINANGTFKKI